MINDAAILYELTCRHKNLLITDGLGLDESFNANGMNGINYSQTLNDLFTQQASANIA